MTLLIAGPIFARGEGLREVDMAGYQYMCMPIEGVAPLILTQDFTSYCIEQHEERAQHK
jgi:hypothetical protein